MAQSSASLSPAEREIVEYGRISGWAIAAILLGVLSAAAIGGPRLWVIPVLAGVVSIVAMRRIQASERRLSGWHLALLGLLLAIFFGMSGPARTLSRQYVLEIRAGHFADKFMDLLRQKQALAAYQLMQPPSGRKVIGVGETELKAKSPEAKKAYDDFLQLAPVKLLLETPSVADVERVSSVFVGSNEMQDVINVTFRVRTADGGTSRSTNVSMYVQRTLAYASHTEQWQIMGHTIKEDAD
jgi:hypothetical protein